MINMDSRIFSFIPTVVDRNVDIRQKQQRVVDEEGRSAFDHFLQAYMDVVNETNYRQHVSDMEQVNFVTGRSNDMLTVVLAQERANSTLNFTVQITNRIVEAYREIMRMQV